MSRNRLQLEGRTFGGLRVIRFVGVVKTHTTWECKCDCGKTVVFQAPRLVHNHSETASCGCLNKHWGRVKGKSYPYHGWRDNARSEAKKEKRTRYIGNVCSKCGGTERMTSSGECSACHKKQKRECYQRHAKQYAHSSRVWRLSNLDRARKTCAEYKKNNRFRFSFLQNLRHAKTKHACPAWVNKDELLRIYKECPDGHEVDHIHPLSGKTSSGLHVPWNLWYLPPAENQRKNNRLLSDQELSQLPGIFPSGYERSFAVMA